MLTNAGGTLATLSFLGTSEAVRKLVAPKLSLALFVGGLFLVGLLVALSTHRVGVLFSSWKVDANRFVTDQLIWGELTKADEERVRQGRWAVYVLGYGAFACFVIGAIIGLCALFSS
jgi:hypothetical protein